MAGFTTNKSTVPLSAITGNGARMKKLVQTIMSYCDDLTIAATNSDTADEYSVNLSWLENTNWVIKAYNSDSSVYFCHMVLNADGTYEQKSSGSVSVLSENSAIVEVNQYDSDLLLVGVTAGDSLANFMCLKVTDQFTGAAKFAVGADDSYYGYYSIDSFYITDGTNVVQCLFDKNANGLTPNDIVSAVPVVCYTDTTDIPLSGFVGSGSVMYYLYQGKTAKSFDTRLTNFTLGGHSFVTLTQTICLKTS